MTRKKPLLVLSQLFYPELVSTGQSMTELCESLSKKEFSIEVICAPPTLIDRKVPVPKIMDYHGIKVRRVWATRFPKLSFWGKLINQLTFFMSAFFVLLRANKTTPILVFTNPPFMAFLCALFRFCGGAPFIYTIYDVYPETAIQSGLLSSYHPITLLWRWVNRFIYTQASTLVVIGRCMETIIKQSLSPSQVPKLKRIHVYNDEQRIIASLNNENPFRARWNLHDQFVVSYSGNMGRFHDMETIIHTAHRFHDRSDITFLFVGDGHKKQWLKDYVKTHKLTNCQFHGYIDREELGLCLSCADVGLVSLLENQVGLSVPSKTMGLMAAGVPVIGVLPKQSEIALIINEEKCGYVTPTGDVDSLQRCILTSYENPQTRHEMGQRGMAAVQSKYSLECAGKIYYDMIISLS